MNILIPFCRTVPAMTVVWSVNGFAQAMLWPPIVRILAGYCKPEEYQSAVMKVTWGCSFGTLFTYVISSVCVTLSGWKSVFFICAGAALAIVIAWTVLYPKVVEGAEVLVPEAHGEKEEHKSKMPKAAVSVLSVILLAVVILGALRDSITTWLPNYIYEIFNVGSGMSVLSGAVIPAMTIPVYPLVLKYFRKFFKNELLCAASIYGFGALASIALYFTYGKSGVLSVVLLAFICACMHGANFMLIGLVPGKFVKYGNIGMISGIINSSVYVGSSVSIWGIASVAHNYGWLVTIAIWALRVCPACFSVCLYRASGLFCPPGRDKGFGFRLRRYRRLSAELCAGERCRRARE